MFGIYRTISTIRSLSLLKSTTLFFAWVYCTISAIQRGFWRALARRSAPLGVVIGLHRSRSSCQGKRCRGRMLPETPKHPLSGIGSSSFIPKISSLADMLWAAGYQTIELLEKVMTSNGNGPALLLQAQRGSRSFGQSDFVTASRSFRAKMPVRRGLGISIKLT